MTEVIDSDTHNGSTVNGYAVFTASFRRPAALRAVLTNLQHGRRRATSGTCRMSRATRLHGDLSGEGASGQATAEPTRDLDNDLRPG
jgi:hypothetical protein